MSERRRSVTGCRAAFTDPAAPGVINVPRSRNFSLKIVRDLPIACRGGKASLVWEQFILEVRRHSFPRHGTDTILILLGHKINILL
jgi:hypothetical protein